MRPLCRRCDVYQWRCKWCDASGAHEAGETWRVVVSRYTCGSDKHAESSLACSDRFRAFVPDTARDLSSTSDFIRDISAGATIPIIITHLAVQDKGDMLDGYP
jgi:NMD protein affecting ribosome stability and mRNA decay